MKNRATFLRTATAIVPLGFGCSNLLGNKTRDEGVRLLSAAYEAGIRHFDVARYYGYGDAEGVVGEFLRTVPRNTVTITTKFGLQPLQVAGRLTGVVSAVRRLMRSSTMARRLVSRNAHRLVRHGRFDVASAASSLEISLRELSTDYVDVLLMHEPTAVDCTPELFEFLSAAQTRGQIRLFGTGAAAAQTAEIVKRAPAFSEVVQFDRNIFASRSESIVGEAAARDQKPTSADSVIITHGSLAAIDPMRQRIARDVQFRTAVNELLQCDASVPGNIAAALLAAAVQSNPFGIVLFRSAVTGRITENVRAVSDRFTTGQLKRLANLCHAKYQRPDPENVDR